MLKSFFHQSSDVSKAIAEAWEQSSCPAVFTVKIIDAGKRGFLGFSHRPATISFTYEPGTNKVNPGEQLAQLKQQQEPAIKKNIAEKTFTTGQQNSSVNKASVAAKPAHKKVELATKTNDLPAAAASTQNNRAPKPARAQTQEKPKNSSNEPKKAVPKKEIAPPETASTSPKPVEPMQPNDVWTEALTQQAADWLSDFCNKFEINTPVKVASFQQETLVLNLSSENLGNSVLGELLKEHSFACACATLIVQTMRNKSGQRFKGLKIRIEFV